MEENSLHILLIGVVFGVLTALALLVASSVWTQAVLPLLRQWRYQGVSISGEWKGLGTGHTPAPGEWNEVALTLKQHTQDLGGHMLIRHRSAGRSFDLNLQVAGRISDGHVTLSLSPANQAIPSSATALLKIDGGGALNGQLLYRDPFAGAIDVINVSVHRAGSSALPRLRPVSGPASVIQVLQTGTPLAAATGEAASG